MIYAWYNETRYGIQFSYKHTKDEFGIKQRADTICNIYCLGDGPLDNLPPINRDTMVGEGFAWLHPDDNFEAEEGRKRSLKKAIEYCEFEPGLMSNKAFRTAIWSAYRARNNVLVAPRG